MSNRKNIVGGNIENRDGIIAIGDNIVIQQLNDTKSPRDYLADLPPLPDSLPFPATPYCGLRWFTRADARIFFGRGDKIKAIYNKLTLTGARSLTFLYGQSGVGKSSLLHAGLIPRLEQHFELNYLRRDASTGIVQPVNDLLSAKQGDQPRLFVLDQLEEIITQPLAGEQQEALGLARLIADHQDHKWLLGFRKEYLAEFNVLFEGVGLEPDSIFVEPLQWSNVLEAVEGVSIDAACQKQYNLSFDEGVAVAITHDIMRDADAHKAPALQILLLKLWRVATGKVGGSAPLQKVVDQLAKDRLAASPDQPKITQHHYQRLIAESGLLMDDFLQEQFDDLEKQNPAWVKRGLLLSLLYSLTTDRGTAGALSQEELQHQFGHVPDLEGLLQELRSRYLITEAAADQNSLRLAHDALAPLIRSRFVRSQAEGPRALAMLESRLKTAATQPQPFDKADLQLILAGQSSMRRWTEEEQDLVQRSKQQQRKKRRQQNGVMLVLSGLLLALSFLGWRTYQGQILQRANLLEANADNIQDPLAKIQGYQASLELNPDNLNCLAKLYATYRDHHFVNTALSLPNAYRVAFQPEGDQLIVLNKIGEGHQAVQYAYDASTDSFRFVRDLDIPIHADQHALVFAQQANVVAMGGYDHQLKVWQLDGTVLLLEDLPDRQSVKELSLSPDGRYLLATIFNEPFIYLRDLEQPEIKSSITLDFIPKEVCFLSSSAGFLVTSLRGGQLYQYSLDGELISNFPSSIGNVSTITWDNQRQLLAFGNNEGETYLLKQTANSSWHALLRHSNETSLDGIYDLIFSSFDAHLAISHLDGIDLLDFNNAISENRTSYSGHSSSPIKGVYTVGTFTPDGRWLAFNPSGGIHSWSLRHLLPDNVTYLPDQTTIALQPASESTRFITGSFEQNLFAWNESLSQSTAFGQSHQETRIQEVQGTTNRIISGDERGQVLIFDSDLESLRSSNHFPHQETIIYLVTSTDEKYLLSYSADQKLILWDIESASILDSLNARIDGISWNTNSEQFALLQTYDQGYMKVVCYDVEDLATEIHEFSLGSAGTWEHLSWLPNGNFLLGDLSGSGVYTSDGLQITWTSGPFLDKLGQLDNIPILNKCPSAGSPYSAIISRGRGTCFLTDESGLLYHQVNPSNFIRGVALCGNQLYILTRTGIEKWYVDRPKPLDFLSP